MKKDINAKLFGLGLLLISGGSVLNLFFHVNDFANGFAKGLGLVLTIAFFYRMKRRPAC